MKSRDEISQLRKYLLAKLINGILITDSVCKWLYELRFRLELSEDKIECLWQIFSNQNKIKKLNLLFQGDVKVLKPNKEMLYYEKAMSNTVYHIQSHNLIRILAGDSRILNFYINEHLSCHFYPGFLKTFLELCSLFHPNMQLTLHNNKYFESLDQVEELSSYPLRSLSLTLEPKFVSSLLKLTTLTDLDIYTPGGANFSDISIVSTLVNLKRLSLSIYTRIQTHDFINLLQLTSLQELELTYNFNPTTDHQILIQAFLSNTSLKSLMLNTFNFTSVPELFMNAISKHINLTNIFFSGYQLSPVTQLLGTFSNLRSLGLRSCLVDQSQVLALLNNTNLEFLNLGNTKIGPENVSLLDAHPNLKFLCYHNNVNLKYLTEMHKDRLKRRSDLVRILLIFLKPGNLLPIEFKLLILARMSFANFDLFMHAGPQLVELIVRHRNEIEWMLKNDITLRFHENQAASLRTQFVLFNPRPYSPETAEHLSNGMGGKP